MLTSVVKIGMSQEWKCELLQSSKHITVCNSKPSLQKCTYYICLIIQTTKLLYQRRNSMSNYLFEQFTCLWKILFKVTFLYRVIYVDAILHVYVLTGPNRFLKICTVELFYVSYNFVIISRLQHFWVITEAIIKFCVHFLI